MKIDIKILIALLLFSFQVFAQKRITTEEYIETYKDIAIKKMKEYRIPASITLAQGILESGSGNSRLAVKGNNHFGIKCHSDWKGKTIHEDDDEKQECFRKYKKAEDSYSDHSKFLTQRGRYSFLFDYETTDYKSWAYGLKKAGYATNPKYPELLIRLIEKYELYKFDKGIKWSRKDVEKEKPKEKIIKGDISLPPNINDFKKVYISKEGRQVYENNRRNLIIIKAGDTFNKIAKEFEIYSWQLFKYNEVNKKHILQIGEKVYLEKKRRKADKKHKKHLVKQGESMRMISQYYGIRLSRLYKMNDMPEGIQPEVGKVLSLR
ncbi:MAG: N-acetylmuramoyl-L-alanine amidase [Marinilabiliales bacterium]|nr:MAG: N-acetylmuramoyl-L-alanine amidase [Marinilabiliales bacterium]